MEKHEGLVPSWKRSFGLGLLSTWYRIFFRSFTVAIMFFSTVPVALPREPGANLRPRADYWGWRPHSRSEFTNHNEVRRGRWRSQLRPHLSSRRYASQNLAEELKKKMIPGLRTERLSDEGRSRIRKRVKALSITSRNKGEFVLPEPTPGPSTSSTSVSDAEKARVEKHRQRFDSMSDAQKDRMRSQMRRVRPLSIEERGDVAQRSP